MTAPLLFLLALVHRDLKPDNVLLDELAELLEEWEAEAFA